MSDPTTTVRLYERLPVTADVSWWQELAAQAPGGNVLYVGCGTGRLALPLASACERLVGVDVEGAMLDAFRRRIPQELEGRVVLVRGAVEELDLGETFGLVVLPSNLLNGIVEPRARTAAVAAAASHCRPDGRVVMQVLNPYWMARQDPAMEGQIEPADGSEPIRVTIDGAEFDAWDQRRRSTITYHFPDGETLVDELDAVALYPRELRALAYQAGLDLVEGWGARPGHDELTSDGGSWHLVARPRSA